TPNRTHEPRRGSTATHDPDRGRTARPRARASRQPRAERELLASPRAGPARGLVAGCFPDTSSVRTHARLRIVAALRLLPGPSLGTSLGDSFGDAPHGWLVATPLSSRARTQANRCGQHVAGLQPARAVLTPLIRPGSALRALGSVRRPKDLKRFTSGPDP